MDKIVADVCVVGGGPGGYVAAIRASQLGLRVVLVEKESLGGVCLNWGCIPTKSLLRSADVFHLCENGADFGVVVGSVKPDLSFMTERSRGIAGQLAAGVKTLMKKNKIEVINGIASFLSTNTLQVLHDNSVVTTIDATNVIIATGARPRILDGFEFDGNLVWSYKDAMLQKDLPKSLVIVGSGAIGMEFGCFYNTLGVDVTVLEASDRILPAEDIEVGQIARKLFEKRGIQFATSVALSDLKKSKTGVVLSYKVDSKAKKVSASRLLMAVGVVPNVEDLSLHEAGVVLDKGRIRVDDECCTNVPSIYAIGDVNTVGPFLAHKASHEGICVAEMIATRMGKLNSAELHKLDYRNIPACIYTRPQIASIGITEERAKEEGLHIKVGRFKPIGNGKAIAMGETDGLIKVVFHAVTGELLGAQMIGGEVTELIQGFGIAKVGELTEVDIVNTIFPHPTMSEMMHEAVLDAIGRVIHS